MGLKSRFRERVVAEGARMGGKRDVFIPVVWYGCYRGGKDVKEGEKV